MKPGMSDGDDKKQDNHLYIQFMQEIIQTQAGIPRGLGSYVTTVTCPRLLNSLGRLADNKDDTDTIKSRTDFTFAHDILRMTSG